MSFARTMLAMACPRIGASKHGGFQPSRQRPEMQRRFLAEDRKTIFCKRQIGMSDTLFEIPQCDSPRLKWLARVKVELQIFTHFCNSGKWMAFSQSKAVEFLAEYDLTQSQKENPIELFAGYCRLLEESKQLADGEPTEEDAIIHVATIHGKRLWNEESQSL